MLIFSLIMYMKKNNALLIGWKRVRSQVIRVQSYNRSLFRLYWLPVMYFSCSLLTKSNMISLAICVINTCKLSKDYKFHLPYGLVIFCCLWKIYSCLLTPSSLEIIFLPILIAWLHWWGEARMNFFSSRRSRGLIKRVILSSYSVRHFVLTMPFGLLWCLNCILS